MCTQDILQNKLSVTRLQQAPTAVYDLATNPFTFSWDSKTLPHPARYGIALSHEMIYLAYYSPVKSIDIDKHQTGELIEGLWTKDVGEFFIKNINSTAYLEFNISPTAAWWCCSFSSYRNRSEDSLFNPQVKIYPGYNNNSGWAVGMEIYLPSLPIYQGKIEDLRANICMIEGDKEQKFLSAATINTATPDFHQSDFYLPLCYSNY